MITFLITISILIIVSAIITKAIWNYLSHTLTVWEHEATIHFLHGKMIGALEPGRHRFWGSGHETKRFDTRWQELAVQGQEFLTKDKASVKVSGLVRFRIIDAHKHYAASAHASQSLYSSVQMALRDVVGGVGIEASLERNDDFGTQLKEIVDPVAETLGYELDTVLIRDLMPSADLKRMLTQVMTAKQESLAGLEKARGEAAAMRVMANAAGVFDKHPALMQLKFLQILEGSTGNNNQLIMGSLDPYMSFLKNNQT
ncbi:MAG: slipin family protein [Akkermansiaceae bacterium]